MAIRRHLVGNMATDLGGSPEKSLSRFHVSFLAQHGIHQIAISVNGPIQITLLAPHFQVDFIHIPGSPCSPTPFDT
jgi:hypothetical protein